MERILVMQRYEYNQKATGIMATSNRSTNKRATTKTNKIMLCLNQLSAIIIVIIIIIFHSGKYFHHVKSVLAATDDNT